MALFFQCDCGRRCWTDEVKPVEVSCLKCGKRIKPVQMTPQQAKRQMALKPVIVKKEEIRRAGTRTAKGRNG